MDRATNKMSTWNGRNLTQAGQVCLTKSILSSQPVYLLTAIKSLKEAREEIDKNRKRFIWAGDKTPIGGKCKVNWVRTTLPKENGGLGVLELNKFVRASDGYGTSGSHPTNHGWELNYPAATVTVSYSLHARQSTSETEQKHDFGQTPGSRGGAQRT